MSVLVYESILGKYARLLFYSGHTVSGLRVCSVSVSTSETMILKHTGSVRTSEPTLPKHTYSGGVCVHTDTLSVSFGYGRATVTVLTVTFHFLWNRSPALPSCKELHSKNSKKKNGPRYGTPPTDQYTTIYTKHYSTIQVDPVTLIKLTFAR